MAKSDFEDKWGQKETDTISRAKYISGFATKNNLDKWASYAKGNSVDQKLIHRQSREDLAPVGGNGKVLDAEPYNPRITGVLGFEEGRRYAPINPAAKPHTYTGKGGTKRD